MSAPLPTDQRRLYRDLTWLWPIVSPPEDYISEAVQFLSMIREHAPASRTLLNLGCGGGHLDYTLKKHFAVTGIDVSESMLALAKQLNPDVHYTTGDMRTVRLDQTFDAVMIADAIDYMLTEDDLRAAFATAFTHLKPGGVFCTYAEETRERFEQNKTDFSINVSDDVEVTLIENFYDPDPDDSTYELTFVYLIRRAGKLEIQTDRHLVGVFGELTWRRLMKEAGFEVCQAEMDDDGSQLFVALRP